MTMTPVEKLEAHVERLILDNADLRKRLDDLAIATQLLIDEYGRTPRRWEMEQAVHALDAGRVSEVKDMLTGFIARMGVFSTRKQEVSHVSYLSDVRTAP